MAEEFLRHGGLSLLEALQYNSEEEIRRRATYLLERHLPSQSSFGSVKTSTQLVSPAEFVQTQNFYLTDTFLCVTGRDHLMLPGQGRPWRVVGGRGGTRQRIQVYYINKVITLEDTMGVKAVLDLSRVSRELPESFAAF